MQEKGTRGTLTSQNARLAKEKWGQLSRQQRVFLNSLSAQYQLSVAFGDLMLLDAKWYVTHSGLLRLATRKSCSSIRTEPVRDFCDLARERWVFKATVYKSPRSKGFVGFGDAEPSNVSSYVHGAEMRMAETRAVNRALRKAYGIGVCSIEEIGSGIKCGGIQEQNRSPLPLNGNGKPRLRDQLAKLIRDHKLDANLVKHYAADFCSTDNLREAKRENVQAFISSLAEQAERDRDALVCRLNSYAVSREVNR